MEKTPVVKNEVNIESSMKSAHEQLKNEIDSIYRDTANTPEDIERLEDEAYKNFGETVSKHMNNGAPINPQLLMEKRLG